MAQRDDKSVSATLAAATCALLGGTASAPVKAQEEPKWEFNTALLYYGEDDDRVQDASLSILAIRDFLDEQSLALGLSVDTLTGATPSGANRSNGAQTFTRPSGRGAYTTAAGDLPLDDTFRDTRVSLSANWQQPLGRMNLVNVGATASREYDYTHLGVNGGIARDFNQRNTSVSAGIAISRDTWDVVGGSPEPLSLMSDVGDLGNRTGEDSKDVIDVVLGVTQVISRDLITQFNYSYSDSSGYLNDPYKIVSVVDATSGDTVPRQRGPGVEGPDYQYRFESRPDNRAKHSLYGQAKYYMDGKVLDASYRYMTDDWEIDSHTIDLRYRWPMGENGYLEPHFRFYTQTEAEFYTIGIVDGEPLPSYASADYRLGDFDATTIGLKYGWTTAGGSDLSVRVELYSQDGDIPSDRLRGNQIGYVEYPDLDALIVQFSYRFSR